MGRQIELRYSSASRLTYFPIGILAYCPNGSPVPTRLTPHAAPRYWMVFTVTDCSATLSRTSDDAIKSIDSELYAVLWRPY
jgi:hypothetical protein